MPDDVQKPDAGTDQQGAGAADTPPVSPPGNGTDGQSSQQQVDWEGRYSGAMRVLSQRDEQLKDLRATFDQTAAVVSDLRKQLETTSAEGDAKVAALAEQLKAITGERDKANTDVAALQSYKTKMEALKEYPQLLPLADTIPDIPDADLMKEHLKLLAKGVEDITTQKAQQLTAGMTPGPTAPANQVEYAYSTLEEWQAAMNGAAGSDEFQKLSEAFLKWDKGRQ